LNILGTAKEYQHQGAATLMVKEFNRIADELNAFVSMKSEFGGMGSRPNVLTVANLPLKLVGCTRRTDMSSRRTRVIGSSRRLQRNSPNSQRNGFSSWSEHGRNRVLALPTPLLFLASFCLLDTLVDTSCGKVYGTIVVRWNSLFNCTDNVSL
jgi:hypothetical protein